ncbi:MAG: hypothetical protein ACRD1L_02445 [Terriglobales bacterium]
MAAPLGFALALAAVLVALWLLASGLQRPRIESALAGIQAKWGTPQERDRNLDALAEFHRCWPRGPEHHPDDFLDDPSWRDLHLDEVYARLDRTLSTLGECALYRILRCAAATPDERERRRQCITAFQADTPLRKTVQRTLLWAGRRWDAELARLLWSEVRKHTARPTFTAHSRLRR